MYEGLKVRCEKAGRRLGRRVTRCFYKGLTREGNMPHLSGGMSSVRLRAPLLSYNFSFGTFFERCFTGRAKAEPFGFATSVTTT